MEERFEIDIKTRAVVEGGTPGFPGSIHENFFKLKKVTNFIAKFLGIASYATSLRRYISDASLYILAKLILIK